MSKDNWLNFTIKCNVCNKINLEDKLYIAKRNSSILICITCECGANNILKIIERRECEKINEE